MKSIRAKFWCNQIIPAVDGYDAKAHLMPVTAGRLGGMCEENESFSNSTPAGHLELVISKDVPAHKFFRQGREYYLDITVVPLPDEEQ